MFAPLIFACCADIKHRMANTFDKYGIALNHQRATKLKNINVIKMPLSVHFALVLAIIIEHFFQILRDAGAVAISLPTEV